MRKPVPVWDDHCRHPPESYLGSVLNSRGEWEDVYLIDTTRGYYSCIRFGDEGHEYKSGAVSPYASKNWNLESLTFSMNQRYLINMDGVESGRVPGCPATALLYHHYFELTRKEETCRTKDD